MEGVRWNTHFSSGNQTSKGDNDFHFMKRSDERGVQPLLEEDDRLVAQQSRNGEGCRKRGICNGMYN